MQLNKMQGTLLIAPSSGITSHWRGLCLPGIRRQPSRCVKWLLFDADKHILTQAKDEETRCMVWWKTTMIIQSKCSSECPPHGAGERAHKYINIEHTPNDIPTHIGHVTVYRKSVKIDSNWRQKKIYYKNKVFRWKQQLEGAKYWIFVREFIWKKVSVIMLLYWKEGEKTQWPIVTEILKIRKYWISKCLVSWVNRYMLRRTPFTSTINLKLLLIKCGGNSILLPLQIALENII